MSTGGPSTHENGRTRFTPSRLALIAYTLALYVGTHWPELTLPEGEIERPDLLVHLGAFGLLGAIAVNARLFGPRDRSRNAALTCLACALYAGFDEGTQAIPVLKRYAVWDDFFANLVGVALGTAGAYALARLLARTGTGPGA